VNNELEKASVFVSRLLSNSTMNDFASLQKEEQILQFLSVNAHQLQPTLSSPAFFPGKTWNQILGVLVESLFRLIDTELSRDLKRIVEQDLILTFISFLRRQNAPEKSIREQIFDFLTKLLKQPEARRIFTGPYTALFHHGADKYLDEIFERKSYIHFEITKVQRLRMSKEEIKGMLAASLLLKVSICGVMSDGSQGYSDRVAGVVQGVFCDKAMPLIKTRLNLLPEPVVESAVRANMSFAENRYIEATARLASIFAARYRSYKANMFVDRGADTPDKSWFSIARKNYKFYGFDDKMLDELYKIAAENGW
jgi:hypothetical protein